MRETSTNRGRGFRFRLRTLMALVVIAAIICVIAAPWVHHLFSPKPMSDFDALIDKITKTIGPIDQDTPLSLKSAGGQKVHASMSTKPPNASDGGSF
ncbi:MAG TPA: hypothetical protein VFE46_17700 [Pirellulales bacterium]|jgi:hypothetical protein|nr:hypothetical protein [Pirellulales bacterium]